MKISRINNNSQLIIYPTSKFKDLTISIQFHLPLTKENISKLALVSGIVVDQSQKYVNKVELNKKLDKLYGANYALTRTIKGNSLVCDFVFNGINGKYLNQDILLDQLNFIKEMIYHPHATQNAFTEVLFNEAKDNLLYQIKAKKDSAARYAIFQALKIYGGDTPLAFDSLGDKDEVMAIDNHQLYQWYLEIIHNSYYEIAVIGDVDEALIKDFFIKNFPKVEQQINLVTYNKNKANLQSISEEADIQQSQLVMVFNGSINMSDKDYYSLAVGCALFGQLPTSLLFSEIREKRSLCYSIYSRLFVFEGGMYVATSMDSSKLAETEELVKTLFTQVQKGEYNPEMVKIAKDMIIDSLRGSYDDYQGILNLAFKLNHVNEDLTFDKTLELINDVKLSDISKAFKNLNLELVYTYKQRSSDENNSK